MILSHEPVIIEFGSVKESGSLTINLISFLKGMMKT